VTLIREAQLHHGATVPSRQASPLHVVTQHVVTQQRRARFLRRLISLLTVFPIIRG
jgi:hypothetical protein